MGVLGGGYWAGSFTWGNVLAYVLVFRLATVVYRLFDKEGFICLKK